MGSRNGWTLLALAAPPALALACSEPNQPTVKAPPPGSPDVTLAEFTRAHAADFDLNGTWTEERSTIRIKSVGEDEFALSQWLPFPGAEARGRMRDGVLFVHPPLDGIAALSPCRIGHRELLLPDVGVTLVPGDPPTPVGRLFRRLTEPRLPGYLPGPDDENRPSPWRER